MRRRTTPGTTRRARAVALAGAVLLAGCAPAADPATAPLDTSAYPPCAEQPPAPDLPDVAGLVLPEGTEVFTATELGPLTQVAGVVAMTPLEARAFYESHPDLEVIQVEDERVEAEVLVSTGSHRLFVKVQITCDGGSNLTATVGTEDVADALPTPAGAAPSGAGPAGAVPTGVSPGPAAPPPSPGR